MKWLWMAALPIALLGAISPDVGAAQPGAYRNEPGPIRHRPAEGVSGRFQLKMDARGTWSTGTGGGCLVADFSASLGESRCVVKQDCETYLASFLSSLPAGQTAAGAHAYCARPDGANEPERCWIRPGPQPEYCVITPGQPLVLNQAVRVPAAPAMGVPVSKLDDGKKVRWMLLTCLNGFDFQNPNPPKDRLGCGHSDANTSTSLGGKAKSIKP